MRAAAAVGIAVSLASCSATAGGSAAPGQNGAAAPAKAAGTIPDACSLASKTDLLAAAGVSTTDDGKKSAGNSCYYAKFGGLGGGLTIQLNATTKEQWSQKKLAFKPVAGVGDDALYAVGTLLVLHGNTILTVIYISSESFGKNTLPEEKEIAMKVLEKL